MNTCKLCGKPLTLTPEYDYCMECQGKIMRESTIPQNSFTTNSTKTSTDIYDEGGIEMIYLIKRKYIRKLKTLGYRYNPVGRYYYLDDGEIRYIVERRVFRAYTMKKIVDDFTFCGVVHKNVITYISEDIDMKPNVPRKWYVEKEK